jgi:hypothetical protein
MPRVLHEGAIERARLTTRTPLYGGITPYKSPRHPRPRAYLCAGRRFSSLARAIAFAEEVFRTTGIVVAITGA